MTVSPKGQSGVHVTSTLNSHDRSRKLCDAVLRPLPPNRSETQSSVPVFDIFITVLTLEKVISSRPQRTEEMLKFIQEPHLVMRPISCVRLRPPKEADALSKQKVSLMRDILKEDLSPQCPPCRPLPRVLVQAPVCDDCRVLLVESEHSPQESITSHVRRIGRIPPVSQPSIRRFRLRMR